MRLSDVHRKAQLWRGIVSISLIEGRGLRPMDANGFSDPYAKFRMGHQKYKSKTIPKTLNPQWREQFDFHLYEEQGGFVDITVWDKDAGKKDDFMGRCTLLLRNFNRVRRCIMFLINTGCYINSCFEWDSPQRSICALVVFIIVVWNFEIYMIPLALLLPLAWNYILFASGKDTRQDVQAVEDLLEDEDEDFDKDDKDSEKKGFMNKLYAIQDVCISVQNALDEVASYGERIKNTFNWTVPFLSWLAIVALGVATVIIYFIPLRFIVLIWGVNKFTKKLRDPYTIDNNELLDYLSRVPSDVQVVQYRELKLDPNPSPNKRKKNNPG
uniref:Multiple C2 domains, transmembrane 1 n=1 Tax=Nothobranchius rachovii TaxID=451742 RepID=A0A1A8S7J9_9TELE